MIDTFSRRVLAWKVSERFEPWNTVEILIEATRNMGAMSTSPTLLTDAGVENMNARVDEFIRSGGRRLLALTEIGFSNSMIESW